MKLFNENSELEVSLRKVEDCMREQGISIVDGYGGLSVGYRGKEYATKDIDTGGDNGLAVFPRMTEGERVIYPE